MAKVELDIVGQAYNMKATQLDAQSSINWYLTVDPTGKFKSALLPRPGLEVFIDDQEDKRSVRGLLGLRDVLYAIIDENLYECYENGSKRIVGTLKTSIGLVYILANDNQLFISDGRFSYFYQIIASSYHPAGYFSIIEYTEENVGTPLFFGAGLDDLFTNKTYTGIAERIYRIQIDGDGSPNTFRWTDDSENPAFSWNAQNVNIISNVALPLNDGVEITFKNDEGHTLNDYWDIKVTPDSTFYTPIIPSYQDGYGIYPKQNSNRFYISDIDRFEYVNALDFALSNVYPDNLVAAISIHDELYLIGETTTEIWYDTGNAEFPFGRKINVVLNYGCQAPRTVKTAADNIIFMLAQNYDGGKIIVKIVNYNVEIISTEPINQELRTYERVEDAFAFTIERNGHIFYVITFPSVAPAGKTWVYDLTTRAWHQWASVDPAPFPASSPHVLGRFRGDCHTVFLGDDIIGDSISGRIFKLKEDVYRDYDTPIICERTTQHLAVKNQYMSINSLQIDVESGIGYIEGSVGLDPQIMLQVSRDGGRSWGSEMWRPFGKGGQYKNRALWYRLGTSRVFTYRFRCTDPVYKVIFGAIADVEVFD